MPSIKDTPTKNKPIAHTPGPWRAEVPTRDGDMASIYAPIPDGADPWRVAYVLREDNPHQRTIDDANARLIAAAPDLLDLVRQYLLDMRYPVFADDSRMRRAEAIERVLANVEERHAG